MFNDYQIEILRQIAASVGCSPSEIVKLATNQLLMDIKSNEIKLYLNHMANDKEKELIKILSLKYKLPTIDVGMP